MMYPLRRKENKPASLASTVLDLPPCCAEFSPARLELVVGCYLLEEVTKTDTGEESTADEESTLKAQSEEARDDQPGDDDTDLSEPRQRRSGSLVVFKINPGTAKLEKLQTEPSPYAVLDLHFHPVDTELLGVAFSEGKFGFYRWRDGGESPLEKQVLGTLHADPNVLVTYFAWAPPSVSSPDRASKAFAATFSSGEVSLFALNPGSSIVSRLRSISLASHSLEAWSVCFVPTALFPDLCILSVGDDIHINSSTLTRPTRPASPWPNDEVLISKFRAKEHDAGVTAILPLHYEAQCLAFVTGSYDEHIRICTMKAAPARPRIEAEKCLGGGVWRLKMMFSSLIARRDPNDPPLIVRRILASCMHAGVKVVDIVGLPEESGTIAWSMKVVAEFEEHESMNYGSDVQSAEVEMNGRGPLVASTSFYDKKLFVWRAPVEDFSWHGSS